MFSTYKRADSSLLDNRRFLSNLLFVKNLQHLSRFEVQPQATYPFGHGKGVSNDINISSTNPRPARGSPSLARARGSLVGRGIANPMSERTRGFEMSRGKS